MGRGLRGSGRCRGAVRAHFFVRRQGERTTGVFCRRNYLACLLWVFQRNASVQSVNNSAHQTRVLYIRGTGSEKNELCCRFYPWYVCVVWVFFYLCIDRANCRTIDKRCCSLSRTKRCVYVIMWSTLHPLSLSRVPHPTDLSGEGRATGGVRARSPKLFD